MTDLELRRAEILRAQVVIRGRALDIDARAAGFSRLPADRMLDTGPDMVRAATELAAILADAQTIARVVTLALEAMGNREDT